MYKQRKAYLEYRHRKWAAGVIALTWVMNVKMATMKRQLKVTRKREVDHFKERAQVVFSTMSWRLLYINSYSVVIKLENTTNTQYTVFHCHFISIM